MPSQRRGFTRIFSFSFAIAFYGITIVNDNIEAKCFSLALIAVVSPDLEKQGFLAVVFVNREYNGEQEIMSPKVPNVFASKN